MDKKNKAGSDWIHSLIIQQSLHKPEEEHSVDLKACWKQIEQCQLADRIREVVADVNAAAGDCILELQDFLPPQATVLRVRFSKHNTEYVLELLARENAAAAVFYSVNDAPNPGKRFFRKRSRSRKHSISLELDFHPAKVLSQDLQGWFSYLLSGFANEFKPNDAHTPSGPNHADFRTAVRKASA